MSYLQEISRATPGYLVILLDQSFSMSYPFGAEAGTKANECAKAVNRVLREIVLACTDGDEIKNSCDVSVWGYGQIKQPVVNAFAAELAKQPVVTIQELTEHCLRVETVKRKVADGAGGLVEIDDQFPIWIESASVGETPMAEAFEMAATLVSEWIEAHPASFPPIVINITDGEANSLPLAKAAAEALTQLETKDGKTLLINAHISEAGESEIILPSSPEKLPQGDHYARFLFELSSELPPLMLERAAASGWNPSARAKGMVYKAKLETLIQLLEIGTKAEFRG
ncbi:MAG: hypothetical protein KME35_10860 [Aphanocapsa sp. GSE-SYN-MK-11-07L]|jgi:hypothetical protein|nr:hypothetical protein [Aphanocapsa sp. GSE-SYN-MK-11-07L]